MAATDGPKHIMIITCMSNNAAWGVRRGGVLLLLLLLLLLLARPVGGTVGLTHGERERVTAVHINAGVYLLFLCYITLTAFPSRRALHSHTLPTAPLASHFPAASPLLPRSFLLRPLAPVMACT